LVDGLIDSCLSLPPGPSPLSPIMPILLSGGPTLENSWILRRMSLNVTPPPHRRSLLGGDAPTDRNPFEDEEDENEANEGKKGGGSLKGFKFKSPLKTLGKLGRNLRLSGRSKGGDTPSPPQGALQASPSEKKKRGRRSSEGSLLR